MTLTAARDLAERARGAPLAQRLATALAIRRPVGGVTVTHVEEAACTAARAIAAAYVRELDGYLAVEAPKERRAAVARMRTSLENVALGELSGAVARGEKIVLTRFCQSPLGTDEDIR